MRAWANGTNRAAARGAEERLCGYRNRAPAAFRRAKTSRCVPG